MTASEMAAPEKVKDATQGTLDALKEVEAMRAEAQEVLRACHDTFQAKCDKIRPVHEWIENAHYQEEVRSLEMDFDSHSSFLFLTKTPYYS